MEINLNQLSPEQRKALAQEALQQEKEAEEKIKQEREDYKSLVHSSIIEIIPMCKKMSSEIGLLKEFIYDQFSTIISIKQDLFGGKENQDSHTFTTPDGCYRIKLGFNMNDDYDDTVNAGIDKVKTYLSTLAKDENSEMLVEAVLKLLAKDQKGHLKASKVMQLQQMAEKSNNKEFVDAVRIIRDAYKPTRSKQYVKVWERDSKNEWKSIPLDMTSV